MTGANACPAGDSITVKLLQPQLDKADAQLVQVASGINRAKCQRAKPPDGWIVADPRVLDDDQQK